MSKKKEIAVIGIGKFGNSVVEELVKLNWHVLAIDKDEQKLTLASRIATIAVADAKDITSLNSLGLAKFQTVIVGTSDNVEIIAGLFELGIKHVIAKANSNEHERVLKQIGVDVIVRPEKEAGIRSAIIATSPNFIKYTEKLQEIGDGYGMGTTNITNKDWLDVEIFKLDFAKFNVSIVSYKRNSKVYIPDGKTKLKYNDLVTFIGKLSSLVKIFQEVNDVDVEKTSDINKKKITSIEVK